MPELLIDHMYFTETCMNEPAQTLLMNECQARLRPCNRCNVPLLASIDPSIVASFARVLLMSNLRDPIAFVDSLY
jgi:hypothetical protein